MSDGEMDALRPKGTVEVRCGYPGCGSAWWLDPLDPRLPDGPFDCGDDHEATKIVQRRLSLLRIRHGLRWGQLMPLGPAKGGPTEGCPTRSSCKGNAVVYDREYAIKRRGLVVWETLADLADIDKVAESVLWNKEDWPEIARENDPQPDPVPEGHVRWVGYKVNESVRRYTFVPCARPDCPHEVMVDVRDPTYCPTGYIVGSWGGGSMPEPEWWGKSVIRCEDGLSRFGTQPCALVRSEALAQFEQASGARWTIWDDTTQGSKRPPITAVLFRNRHENRYGVLFYPGTGRETFETSARIAQAITWGTFPELARSIGFNIVPGQRSAVLEELETQSHQPS